MLLGHSRFKALELAPRAHVPRQKIYEVLDSLVEKGFARVVRDRTKLFSAVEPNLAIPAYLARKRQFAEQELTDQARSASNLMEDLSGLYPEGKRRARECLDFLRIVAEPTQIAGGIPANAGGSESGVSGIFASRRMRWHPLDEMLVKQACGRGVLCRLLIESGTLDETPQATVGGVCDGGSGDPAVRRRYR